MAIFPWFDSIRSGRIYNHESGVSTKDFLSLDKYTHANAWADRIAARPAVARGLTVCSFNGGGKPWLEKK